MIKLVRFVTLTLLICLMLLLSSTHSQAAAPPLGGELSPKMVDKMGYGRIPLHFEPNWGQIDRAEVDFVARGSGYSIYTTPAGLTLALRQPDTQELSVLQLLLVDANLEAEMIGTDPLPGVSHYFMGTDLAQWQTNIPNYEKVRYEQVWPGVDLVLYGNQRHLEYDFVVEPGADPAQIALDFNGANALALNERGDLSRWSLPPFKEVGLYNPTRKIRRADPPVE